MTKCSGQAFWIQTDTLPVGEDLIPDSGPRANLDFVLALHLLSGTAIGMMQLLVGGLCVVVRSSTALALQ